MQSKILKSQPNLWFHSTIFRMDYYNFTLGTLDENASVWAFTIFQGNHKGKARFWISYQLGEIYPIYRFCFNVAIQKYKVQVLGKLKPSLLSQS